MPTQLRISSVGINIQIDRISHSPLLYRHTSLDHSLPVTLRRDTARLAQVRHGKALWQAQPRHGRIREPAIATSDDAPRSEVVVETSRERHGET